MSRAEGRSREAAAERCRALLVNLPGAGEIIALVSTFGLCPAEIGVVLPPASPVRPPHLSSGVDRTQVLEDSARPTADAIGVTLPPAPSERPSHSRCGADEANASENVPERPTTEAQPTPTSAAPYGEEGAPRSAPRKKRRRKRRRKRGKRKKNRSRRNRRSKARRNPHAQWSRSVREIIEKVAHVSNNEAALRFVFAGADENESKHIEDVRLRAAQAYLNLTWKHPRYAEERARRGLVGWSPNTGATRGEGLPNGKSAPSLDPGWISAIRSDLQARKARGIRKDAERAKRAEKAREALRKNDHGNEHAAASNRGGAATKQESPWCRRKRTAVANLDPVRDDELGARTRAPIPFEEYVREAGSLSHSDTDHSVTSGISEDSDHEGLPDDWGVFGNNRDFWLGQCALIADAVIAERNEGDEDGG